jgi:hypothetical protein
MQKLGEKLTLVKIYPPIATCHSARRSQQLTLSTDKWYYIVEITLPV